VSVTPADGGSGATDIAAIIAEELTALAADAQALGNRLSTGDIVSAIVLPSNGLTDLLDVGGLRVAAELPPALVPGETITVLVTGFAGDRINLQIVPTPDDAIAPAVPAAANALTNAARLVVPSATLPAAPQVRNNAAPGARSAAAPASDTASRPARTGGAPASRTAPPVPAALSLGARLRSATVTATAAPAPRGPANSIPRSETPLQSIEARLAASHATAPAAPRLAGAGPVAPRPPLITRSPILPERPAGGAPTADAAAARAAGLTRPPGAAAAPLQQSATATTVSRGPAAFMEPAALLRGLHLPLTATNLAAARLALDAPQKLPAALNTLERALSDSADPRLATLKTLASFLARLDPRSPVFAAQVAAFTEHVVTGREARLAQLLPIAELDAEPTGTDDPAETDTARAPEALVAPSAERNAAVRTALDFDFKSQLLAAAAASDGNDVTPQAAALERAITGALTAMTSLQLSAAAALQSDPDGLTLCIPVALPDGFAQAQVRIGRDAPGRSPVPLDGDNFHIAFVLDTRRLGTIAIELTTVGRSVSLSVKTEAALAQHLFGRALSSLTDRLERLKYRVVSTEAVVASRRIQSASVLPDTPDRRSAVAGDPNHRVDADA
jgi:hypothetical protein